MAKARNTKIVDGVQYNQCTKCEKWFPATIEHFDRRLSTSFGLQARCRKCFRIQERERNLKRCDKVILYLKEYHQRPDVKQRKKERILNLSDEERQKRLEYYREYNKKHKDRRKKQRKIRYKKNKEKIKADVRKYRKENREEILKRQRKKGKKKAKFKTFDKHLTIEESAKEGKDGELLVKCAYCGKYFTPLNKAVWSRIQGLRYIASGENRLYCSDGCKSACPIFWKREWPEGYKKASSREVDPLIRQMCLERDNYTCQRCEKTIDKIELHAHHIEGVKHQPMLANDVDNTITLCKKCHKWVHTQEGCTYYDMRCKK